MMTEKRKDILINSWMQDPRCKHKYLDNLSNDVILLMMMKLFLIRLAMYQYNKYCNRHKSKPLWYLLYRIYRKIKHDVL